MKTKGLRRPFGQKKSVSLFTLGTMRALESEEQMYRVVKAAFHAGINHLETAPAYGPAEIFLGKALRRLKQEEIEPDGGWIITSKILPGSSFCEGKKQLKNLLSRLKKERIDNLAVHGLNLYEHLHWTLDGDGAKLLRWAQEEGLISQVGFSSHGELSLIKEGIKSKRFDFCSLHLHLLDPERIPLALYALDNGMGVMAISPADKGGRLFDPSPTLIKDCSPYEPIKLAYRFLLAKGISTLTIGAFQPKDLNIAKQLLNASENLDQKEINAINHLQKQRELRLGETLCGQCKQCLPCPQAVPINEILRLRNLSLGHDLTVFAKERYNLIGKAGHWWETVNATACNHCGDCMPRCPNNLPIPNLLEETHQLLAAAPRRRLWS